MRSTRQCSRSPSTPWRASARGIDALDLNDEETAVLEQLLLEAIEADRYFLSPRMQAWRAILNKIGPGPPREPLPPLRYY